MATLVLGAAGAAIGGSFGGAILGVSAASIGGFIGSSIGSMIDARLMGGSGPGTQRFEGARLDSLRVTSADEGAVISRVFGRMRVAGNMIWATDFEERSETTRVRQRVGKRRRTVSTTTEYLYSASFAIGLCEGPITGIGRVWADGKPLDLSGVEMRLHTGAEDQEPDPLIVARMGAARAPAYRGTAYVVFEDFELEAFGNRIPQLSFEVFRPLPDDDVAEGCVGAVTIIPASGESVYGTEIVTVSESATPEIRLPENAKARTDQTDFVTSIEQMRALAPGVKSVSLVVAWFGDDLRAGHCELRPGVEFLDKTSHPAWSVGGVSRADAHLVSRDAFDRPIYGGTPSDRAVVQAIQHLKAQGYRVTFYPFILMDVPEGNALPNPYSDNAAEIGQPALPWRGRITCSPAPGFAGSPDGSFTAAAQLGAFFGTAAPGNFSVSGESVSWTGGSEWGQRRMILHYAHLCAAAGGVDAFLIGSEMRALTQVRSAANFYNAVQRFRDLAADCRAVLGAGTKISYAADWSEYFGHHPGDGTGDVFFHLDPLWADPNIDFIGIDNYQPISDWRDGFEHLDALDGVPAIYDRAYLQSNIAGGEGFDWFYASDVDRAAQIRTPITDGAYGKDWVFRYKDLRSWWSEPHFDRPGGIESTTPTAWVPQSKPFWFTELGCPAVDRGTNQPNVFFDQKSSESFVPYFSRGYRDDAIQRAYLEAVYLFWASGDNNPVSPSYGGSMVNMAEGAAWTWDARPYPYFPALSEVWADGDNWQLGHWLTGRLGSVSLAALVRHLCAAAGMPAHRIDVSGLWGAVEGYVIPAIESPRSSIAPLMEHFGFDATETEGLMRFAMRGGASRRAFALDDLVASDDQSGELIELVRGQETELPLALKWSLARSDADYDAVVVEAQRRAVDTARIHADVFAIAAAPELSERCVARALGERWVARETAAFRLPPSDVALDPGDMITLAHDGRETSYRITRLHDGRERSVDAVRADREVYDLPVAGARAATVGLLTPFSGAVIEFLDLPPLGDMTDPHQPRIAAYAAPWPGALALWRAPDEADFADLGVIPISASFGSLAAPMGPGPVAVFDLGTEIELSVIDARLASVSDIALFGGANMFAIQTVAGAWEIVQAAEVELVAPGFYRLRRLLRGQRGTERHVSAPKAAGARVVVLDAAVAQVPIAPGDLGIGWNWRIGPLGLDFADPRMIARSYQPTGEGLRPFSPVHVAQPWRRARVPGDYTISWIRRDRDPGADSWAAAEVPMSEASEAYEVEILDGASVLRVLTASAPQAVYTAAQQVEDFGAALGPGDTLRVRITQMSASFGGGAPADVILQF